MKLLKTRHHSSMAVSVAMGLFMLLAVLLRVSSTCWLLPSPWRRQPNAALVDKRNVRGKALALGASGTDEPTIAASVSALERLLSMDDDDLEDNTDQDDIVDDILIPRAKPRTTGWGWNPNGPSASRKASQSTPEAKQATSKVPASGSKVAKTPYTALLQSAAKRGDVMGAKQLLEEAKRIGAKIGQEEYDLVFALAQIKRDPAAMEYFVAQAIKAKFRPDSDVVNSGIILAAKAGVADKMHKWLSLAKDLNMGLSVGSYNALLQRAAADSDPDNLDDVAKWLTQATNAGVPFDVKAMLKAAGDSALIVAELWWELAMEAGGELNPEYVKNPVYVASKLGDIPVASRWLERCVEAGVLPDIKMFNFMLNSALQVQRIDWVDLVLADLKTFDMKPDLVTFTTMVRAAALRGDIGNAEKWFRSALQNGIKCDIFMYNTLIDAAAKSGNLKSVERWFKNAVTSKMVTPNDVTFNTIMHAYMKNGHGKETEEYFLKMLKANVAPTAFTLRTLRWAVGRDRMWELSKQNGVDSNRILNAARPQQGRSRSQN